MLKKLSRYYHTLKHLRPIQVRYQLWYKLRNRFFPVRYPEELKAPKFQEVTFTSFPNLQQQYLGSKQFQFLNVEQSFKNEIEWNYLVHGKLWVYHLNYFEYLHQPGMEWDTGMALIESFLENTADRKEGMEPYPVSLRTINWIKFLSKHNRFPGHIVDSLYAQYQVLTKKIEYHLLGNHLFENGISLLFGAVAFNDRRFYKKAESILRIELKEQVLDDGGHFERSPMYHLILLNRLLDAYNLLINNDNNGGFDFSKLEEQIKKTAERMMGWLVEYRFGNGDLPAVNDSTRKLPLNIDDLFSYASRMGLSSQKKKSSRLGESGYKMVRKRDYELFIDAGKPGPDYIPGHAHCDIFSFLLYVGQTPFVVDTGVSTYEENDRRLYERSTSAHNTVMVNGGEQSEIWKSFRMGRRAKISDLKEYERNLIGFHDGFKENRIKHERRFSWSEREIKIHDLLHVEPELPAKAFFHLHPGRICEQNARGVWVDGHVFFEFEGSIDVEIRVCEIAFDFNETKSSSCIEVGFLNGLKTTVRISGS